MIKKFPSGFVWGVSTAAHQIEGGLMNDWTEWEQTHATTFATDAPSKFAKTSPVWEQIKPEATSPANYISGIADDSFHKYREDVGLMVELGVTASRFSIEWARIEPKEGEVDQTAIQHYKDVIAELRKHGIEPWVTTLHRTLPAWVAKQGGWANKKTVRDYGEYVTKLAEEFGSDVKFWMPLNEPVLNVGGGFVVGIIPPGKKNIFTALRAYGNMIAAHNHAYDILHKHIRDSQVGCAHAAVYAEGFQNKWYNNALVALLHYLANWKFLNGIKDHVDFIGIQYYTRGVLKLTTKNFLPSIQNVPMPGPRSDLVEEIYPVGLYNYARMIWQRYHKPIYVTENGIADRNDTYRAQYIKDHVAEIHRAIEDGIDMRGYFHWSLIDNFEWDTGFWPRFGLAAVDRQTLTRTLRPSAKVYSDIIKNNSV